MKKENLPVKICFVCGQPMTWRRKWSKTWEEVKYCSERCRRNKRIQLPDAAKSSPGKKH